jgi:hypothetical protein
MSRGNSDITTRLGFSVGLFTVGILLVLLFIRIHPSQQVSFTGLSKTLEADLWFAPPEMQVSMVFILVEAENWLIAPSPFFNSEQGYQELDYSRPGRVPLVLTLHSVNTTEGTKLPASASRIEIKSSTPIHSQLLSSGSTSLHLLWANDQLSLSYAEQGLSESQKEIRLDPSYTQPTQSFSLFADDKERSEYLMTLGQGGTSLTILLNEDNRANMSQADIRWAGVWLLGRKGRAVNYKVANVESVGRIGLYLPNGQLTIKGKSESVSSSSMLLHFIDNAQLILTENQLTISGKAKRIASDTSEQILPSLWESLPLPVQGLIGAFILAMLGTALNLLGLLDIIKQRLSQHR